MGIATGFPCQAAFLAVRYQNIVRMIPVLEPLLLNGRVNAFYAPFDFKWGISLRTAGRGLPSGDAVRTVPGRKMSGVHVLAVHCAAEPCRFWDGMLRLWMLWGRL